MKVTSYFAEHKVKLIKTWLCVVSFLGLGGVCTVLGASLLDLQILLGTPFAVTSNLVPARSIGYLIGGVISGFLDRWAGPDLILFASNFLAGLFIVAAPWFRSFYEVYSFILLSGVAQGIFDIVCNTYVLLIWKNNPQLGSYVQILHGSFGIGSLLTPLVTQPFLLPINETTNGTISDADIVGDWTPDDVKIQWPFLIVSSFLFISSIGFLAFHWKGGFNKHVDQVEEFTENEPARWKKFIGIVMLALSAHLSSGINVLISSLGPSFAVKSDLHLDKQTGASLISVFWICINFYKLIFIIGTNFIGEKYLMIFSHICSLASIAVLIPSASYNSVCLFVGTVLLGIGYATLFTVALSRVQSYFTLSNSLASLIFINGSLGEAIHPWIVSKLMDWKPVTFVYYIGVLASLNVLNSIMVPFICDKIFQKEVKRPKSRTVSVLSWAR